MSDYKLKFLFANHDGVSVEVTFPENATGLSLKQALISSNWPEGKVDKVSGPSAIRLLCMGKMVEDSKTLAEMKIPRYEHPTPVNVSLLPNGKSYSEHVGGNNNQSPTKSISAINSHNTSGAQQNRNPGTTSCCTIM